MADDPRPPSSWPQAPPEAPGHAQAAAPAGTNGRATAALVLGIVGVILIPLLPSVLALFFGYRAKREIADSHGRQGGRGQAIAGIVLGWIGLVLGLLFVLVVIGGVVAVTD